MLRKRRKGNVYPDLEDYIKEHYVDAEVGEVAFSSAASAMASQPSPRFRGFMGLMGAHSKGMMPTGSAMASREAVPLEEEEAGAPEDSIVCDEEASYDDALDKLTDALDDRMSHMADTFSEYLMYLIESKELKNADVYKAALIDKKVFSKIKNNPDYHPNKNTALCLCMGAKLNLDESRDLLARAGYALSPCSKTDIIFSYFIENEIYDMIELDIQLEEHGLECMIS